MLDVSLKPRLWLHVCCVLVGPSCLTLRPWTVAHWAHLSVGFSRQQPWGGLPRPSPGGLPAQQSSQCLVPPAPAGVGFATPFPRRSPSPAVTPVCLAPPAPAGVGFATSATWACIKSVAGEVKVCISCKSRTDTCAFQFLKYEMQRLHVTDTETQSQVQTWLLAPVLPTA